MSNEEAKQPPERDLKVFDYLTALAIRRRINISRINRNFTEWAKIFKVHRSTISRIMNEKTYPTYPEHKDYITGQTDTL